MTDFYKMEPADWDFGTANLTLEQEAAYLRIVNAMHKHKGPVPDNDRVLAGMFRCSTRKARSLIEALLAAGKVQIDGGKISNERAASDLVQRGFVSISRAESGAKGGRTKAERAAKALATNDTSLAFATPRVEKSREEKKRDTIVSLSDPAFDLFNEFAAKAGWPSCQTRGKGRVSAIVARVKEAGGLDGWRIALEKAEASDFLCNRTKAGFTATIDFILQKSSFTKLMEGNYDNRTGNTNGTGRNGGSAHDKLMAGFAAVADQEQRREGFDFGAGDGTIPPGPRG